MTADNRPCPQRVRAQCACSPVASAPRSSSDSTLTRPSIKNLALNPPDLPSAEPAGAVGAAEAERDAGGVRGAQRAAGRRLHRAGHDHEPDRRHGPPGGGEEGAWSAQELESWVGIRLGTGHGSLTLILNLALIQLLLCPALAVRSLGRCRVLRELRCLQSALHHECRALHSSMRCYSMLTSQMRRPRWPGMLTAHLPQAEVRRVGC